MASVYIREFDALDVAIHINAMAIPRGIVIFITLVPFALQADYLFKLMHGLERKANQFTSQISD